MEYNWKGDALAKLLLLFLLLAILINSVILTGFQVITQYPYQNRDEIISAFSDYNCVDSRITDKASAWLFAAPGKASRLIVSEKHFLLNRHRLLLDQEAGRGFSADIKADCGTVTVQLSGSSEIGNFTLRSNSVRIAKTPLAVPAPFFLWNLLMLALECIALWVIHKLRNG